MLRPMLLATVLLSACSAPVPTDDGGAAEVGSPIDVSSPDDAMLADVPRLDVPIDGPLDDAGADGGGALAECTLADGHDCTRWVRTEPDGVWSCLGYDGLGAVCEGEPSPDCVLADGHDCTRWVRTEPDGVWSCLGYDGLGAVCEGEPSPDCVLADGHDCTRWVRTEPDGVWACLGYDGLGAVCE